MTHTTTTHTAPGTGASAGQSYTLPEAHRQAILAGADSARCSAFIHAQRDSFMSKNHGFEFGQDYEAGAANNACAEFKTRHNVL